MDVAPSSVTWPSHARPSREQIVLARVLLWAGTMKISFDGRQWWAALVLAAGLALAGCGSAGTCVGGDCSCGADEDCSFDCSEGGCNQACAPSSTCTLTCTGGDCSQSCSLGATCTMGCEGGGCTQACGTNTSCTATCGDSTCVSDT